MESIWKRIETIRSAVKVPIIFYLKQSDLIYSGKLKAFKPYAILMRRHKSVELERLVRRLLKRTSVKKENTTTGSELQKYKDIFDQAAMGIFQADLNWRIVIVNHSFAEMLGYENSEDLIQKELQDFFVDKGWFNDIASTISFDSERTFEVRCRNKEGRPIWVQLVLKGVIGADGNIVYFLGFINNIDEKKKVKISLAEIKSRFYQTLDKNKIGLWDWALKTNTFTISHEWMSQLGYSYKKSRMSFEEWIKLIHPADRETVSKKLKEYCKGIQKDYEAEYRIRSKDGNYIWVLDKASVENDANGKPGRILGSSIDISAKKKTEFELMEKETEEKLAEIKIREGETKFRQLAENINDVFFISSPDLSRLHYVSPRIEQLWGISADIIYKEPVKLIIPVHPQDREMLRKAIREVRNTGRFDLELRIIQPDKSEHWVRWRAFPVADESGQFNKIAAVAEDITEKKYWEDQVQKLSKAVKQSPVIILITDKKGAIEYVNPKFVDVTGYTLEEVVGKNPRILSSGYVLQEDYSSLWNTIFDGKEWQGEFQNKKKNGELFWVSASISPIIDERGRISHFLAVEEDITSWKEYEKELIVAKEHAEMSNRLKSEFLAQMSHEIRTPLNNILTYTSLLQEELEDKLPEGLESTFYVISRSANRLIRTIDLILNLSKIQTGNFEYEFEKIDLDNDILLDLVLEFHNRAKEKNIKIIYECKADHKIVNGDSNTIGQIFVNLVENSIKYTNKGQIKVILYNEGEKVCVDVADSGIGISKYFLPRLFEPFTQEDSSSTRNYEGNGLGLTLVKNYVEINKAEISVSTQKGKGSIFSVKFNPADKKD